VTLRVQILKDKFNQSLGLPFKELLPEPIIKQAISELKIKYKKRLFDPFVTLWAFLSQVLDTDKTCHNTVSKIIAHLAESEVEIPSKDTSAYCQARARLPEKLRARHPTLVVPYSHDQPDNAARVERLGISRTIPRKQYSAVRVIKQLRELLGNPNYAAKAAEIGSIIQAENGLGVARDAIEQ
jgi:hypothetical protein